ncbi:hypothetical protein KQI18_09260 [Clostridioides mangenotii]|uniref:hypothetical protein n=1 Tax=Metaclostridioides mangenotii TaxID=1540 RepID=UPI001C10EF48|nr:hypothetical protein [Clostridioides mangenotii]MBU5307973.1 hypothetical protein [Clostridioides mangenotii]
MISTLLFLLVTVKIYADSDTELQKADNVMFRKGQTHMVAEVSTALNKGLNDYINSDEYKNLMVKTDLEKELGIKIKEIKPIVCKITYYSSLACENGPYGLKTASGVNMNSKTVANNFLKFGTDLYIEGQGHKVVEDTGSNKHFNTVNRFDVYVPRNENESDDSYYKRVNNMGRKTSIGYIIVKE